MGNGEREALIIHFKVGLHVLKVVQHINKILWTGPKKVFKLVVVTRDVGFKPTSGLKWKENQAITKRMLQQIRDYSKLSNLNTSSSSKP
ncbi:hypothetical protein R3W88_011450 [Solanum pinnatisectum]|uniref:Uncharacterized protein n=1 Tax=Solanum pinnatisectum TaxID=50273 RepID=A0AAV9L7B9_9SOLN|nr:hypothetical protein R3W88_011450 [Solanum pinnatisectum]